MKKKNDFLYIVIGIMTLALSVIGATYAYYTFTDTTTENITGDMATITFNLKVDRMTTGDITSGLVPLSNTMVESATVGTNNETCIDDNGNAVCQIYRITVENAGTAGMFLDGYVTLTGGSGTATDYADSPTTMRWAQAFCEETSSTNLACTTAGKTTTSVTNTTGSGLATNWGVVEKTIDEENDILKGDINYVIGSNSKPLLTTKIGGIVSTAKNGTISGNSYDGIDTNFIRTSIHADGNGYTQVNDVTSALVYNEFLSASDGTSNNPTGGSGETYTDSQVYYIVVWLAETGTNQMKTETTQGNVADNNSEGAMFFSGNVTFVSAQGSEVTATFSQYTPVAPDTVNQG